MILSDFHVHSTFSDGKNTPEEIVLKAISAGIKNLGFSDHSYTLDESYCMSKEKKELYINTISALKERYSNDINIYCGVEQDFYSTENTEGFDYVIGSVHYVKANDDYIAVDKSLDYFKLAVERYFEGDCIKFAESYFKTVADVVKKTNCDIIGHFDLITKFNGSGLFDETDKKYINAWKSAADELLKCGKPFEINTGAISRGYRTFPYPSLDIIDYIKKNGGRFILSSDAHSAENLCFQFDKWEYLTK